MEKYQRRKFSFLLALLLCFMSVAHFVLPVWAEDDPEPEIIDGILYEADQYGEYIGTVTGGDVSGGNITVPSHHHLMLGVQAEGNDLAGVTVTIESGASLEIWDNVTFAGTLDARDGALLKFGSSVSVPEGITLYDASGENLYSGQINYSVYFCWVGEMTKWVEFVEEPGEPGEPGEPEEPEGPPFFRINFDGFDPNSDTVTVGYKYRTEDGYSSVDTSQLTRDPWGESTYYVEFELENVPDSWDGTPL